MFWTIAAYKFMQDEKHYFGEYILQKQFRFDEEDEAIAVIKKWCLRDGITEEEFNQELYRDDDEYFKEFYGESGLLYELRFN